MKFSKRRLYLVLAVVIFLAVVFTLTGYVFIETSQKQPSGLKIQLPPVATDSTVPVGGVFTGFFIFLGSPVGISLVVLMIFLFLAFLYKKWMLEI
jgi:hypothetical protein